MDSSISNTKRDFFADLSYEKAIDYIKSLERRGLKSDKDFKKTHPDYVDRKSIKGNISSHNYIVVNKENKIVAVITVWPFPKIYFLTLNSEGYFVLYNEVTREPSSLVQKYCLKKQRFSKDERFEKVSEKHIKIVREWVKENEGWIERYTAQLYLKKAFSSLVKIKSELKSINKSKKALVEYLRRVG